MDDDPESMSRHSAAAFEVDFHALDWQPALPGARMKVHRDGNRQLRLVEFTSASRPAR